MPTYIEPEVDVERSITTEVRILDVVLGLELAPGIWKLLLQEFSEPVNILDVIADDASANQVATS
jgi:hypothetical protein